MRRRPASGPPILESRHERALHASSAPALGAARGDVCARIGGTIRAVVSAVAGTRARGDSGRDRIERERVVINVHKNRRRTGPCNRVRRRGKRKRRGDDLTRNFERS